MCCLDFDNPDHACRQSGPVNFTLGSPARVVLFFAAAPRDGGLPVSLESDGWVMQGVSCAFDWEGAIDTDRFASVLSKEYDKPITCTLPAHNSETIMALAICPTLPPAGGSETKTNTSSNQPSYEAKMRAALQQDVVHGFSTTPPNACHKAQPKIQPNPISTTESVELASSGQGHGCKVCSVIEEMRSSVSALEGVAKENEDVSQGTSHGENGFSFHEEFKPCVSMAIEVELLAEECLRHLR